MPRTHEQVRQDRYALYTEWLYWCNARDEVGIRIRREILQSMHDGPLLNPLGHPFK